MRYYVEFLDKNGNFQNAFFDFFEQLFEITFYPDCKILKIINRKKE